MEDAMHGPARRIVFLSNDLNYLLRFRGPVMRLFADKGFDVVAIAPPFSTQVEASVADYGARWKPWRLRPVGTGPLAELKSIGDLVGLLRDLRPDILFAHTIKPVIYGMLAAALVGVRRRVAMITGLGYAFIPGAGVRRRLVGLAGRAGYAVALRLAHQVIFHNDEDRALFERAGLTGRRTQAGVTGGSGVDLSSHAFAPMPEGPPVYLLVSRLQGDKGVYEFISAARIVREKVANARFVLVGAPDSHPTAVKASELAAWAAEGLIEYRGYLEDPREEYRRCSVFVLPSYREGAPRVNLEAMAAGRALVTTDVPGCRRTVIDGRNGILVPARDVERLAEAMIALGSDPGRARAMGLESRRLCEQLFDLEVVARHTASLIEGPLQPSRRWDPSAHPAGPLRSA